MARNLDQERLKVIHQEMEKLHRDHTMSQVARILKITPSSVRHHGKAIGLTFKTVKRWSTKKIVPVEGEFFDESHRENWLV